MSSFPRAAAAIAVATALFSVAPAAQADPPTRIPQTVTNTATVTDLCAFPVTITGTVTGLVTVQDNGTTTTLSVTGSEQETFSANGVTLTGLPYKFRLSLVIDDTTGNIVGGYAAGVVERVPLPDGGLFISAGRVDEVLHADQTFTLVPDVGHSGDLAALCAALS